MWRPNTFQWWFLLIVALFIMFAWPPSDNKSLGVKFVNWAVDPWDELPIETGPLPVDQEDNPDAVYKQALQARHYDALYEKGGWTRWRLELKVARDPLDPVTERQILGAIGVLTLFLAWPLRGPKN
jgi:hypothetical protein